MNIDLSGKTALVAGSTQGIGKCTAEKLAESGAKVVLISRNEDKLKHVLEGLHYSEELEETPHSFIVADFSDPEQVKNKTKDYIDQHGGFNILVNNTGGPPGGPVIEADPQEFLDAFNAHLICNHLLVQLCFPHMKKNLSGRVINIVSTSVKAPITGLGVSNTVRGAVANWSKTMANELGRYGITVNNVLPGATNTSRLTSIAEKKSKKTGKSIEEVLTEMNNAVPVGRVAEPEETANAVAFLASNEAGYISGTNLPVDGGRTPTL